jgi:hypothetical protein
MLKLTYENFVKARNYIFTHSDDINRAWFRYNFENGDAYALMDALAKYQHENGGFGGLDYEFEYQGPCLKCTEHAIGYIINFKEKPSAEHPVIRKMMKYILEHYLPEIGNWGPEVVVPEVNDGVHCRWARYRGYVLTPIENEDERIKNYDANEKVCFAAFVALYSELVPEGLYRDIIKYPIEYILRYYDKNSPDYNKGIFDEGSPYDFDYFQWFVPCLKDKDTVNKLTSILRQNPTAFMELDFTKSDSGYVHLPCDLAGSPDNIIYPAVKKLVDDSLEYRMKQQSGDGRWSLGWALGEGEGFHKLQVLYEASRTMGMLAKLRRFSKIKM